MHVSPAPEHFASKIGRLRHEVMIGPRREARPAVVAFDRTRSETDMNGKPAGDGVQLGCGTLIIIALIVVFFSGSRDTKEMRAQLDEMSRRMERIEQKLDALAERPPTRP